MRMLPERRVRRRSMGSAFALLLGVLSWGVPACVMAQPGACAPAPPISFASIRANIGRPIVHDTISLVLFGPPSGAAHASVRASDAMRGVRCAIDLMVQLGGLHGRELEGSPGICELLQARADCAAERRRGGDAIGFAQLVVFRDGSSGAVVGAELEVIGSGGPTGADGSRLQQQYDVRLRWGDEARRWYVTSYHVGIPE